MMKYCFAIVLVCFIAIAGYQFGFYHGKLVNSSAKMERLNTVLEHSRSFVTQDLNVIKATVKTSNNARHQFNSTDAATSDTDKVRYARSHLIHFLDAHPNGDALTLNQLTCSVSQCEFQGEYRGSQDALARLLKDLEVQTWWQYTATQEVTHGHSGLTQIDVIFSIQDKVVIDIAT